MRLPSCRFSSYFGDQESLPKNASNSAQITNAKPVKSLDSHCSMGYLIDIHNRRPTDESVEGQVVYFVRQCMIKKIRKKNTDGRRLGTKGFTLIELLVVIAIIAILAG